MSRFVDNKDYPEPDNDAYYDLPANSMQKKHHHGEWSEAWDKKPELKRCPVKPKKWWNR